MELQSLDQLFSVILSFALINGLINISYYLNNKKFKYINNKSINFFLIFFLITNFIAVSTFIFSITVGVNKGLINVLSIFIILLGFYKPFYFRELRFFFKKDKYHLLIIILILSYLLLSTAPISDNDSLDYHITVPLYSLKFGEHFFTNYWVHSELSGTGESLLMFGASIGAYHFGQVMQFISLLFLVIIIFNFSYKGFFKYNNNNIIILSILLIPSLIFLCSTSKFQLFPAVSNFLCLLIAVFYFDQIKKKQSIILFTAITFLLMATTQMKFSFFLSSGLITFILFYEMYKKKVLLIAILITFVVFAFVILPREIYEYLYFRKDIIFNFFNPVTAEYTADFANKSLRHGNGNSKLFPIWIFLPFEKFKFNLGVLTYSLGLTLLLGFININLKDNKINKIFLISIIFFFLAIIFGQPTGRFFLEPAIWFLFVSGFYISHKNHSIFKFIKKIVLIMSIIFIIPILFFGVYSNTAYLSQKNYEDYMSQNSDGYSLFKWANNILPTNSRVISTHRSHALSKNFVIPYDFRYYVKKDDANVFLKYFKKLEPTHILYTDYELNRNYDYLKNCRGNLIAFRQNIGNITGRNPFNKNNKKYDGYIFEINSKLIQRCIDRN